MDNDVIWHSPLPPLTSELLSSSWVQLGPDFSHISHNAAPNSRHFFVNFISVFLRLRLGTESDVWWEADGGWRGQRLTSPGPVSSLGLRRGCVLCPPLDWPLQSSPGAALLYSILSLLWLEKICSRVQWSVSSEGKAISKNNVCHLVSLFQILFVNASSSNLFFRNMTVLGLWYLNSVSPLSVQCEWVGRRLRHTWHWPLVVPGQLPADLGCPAGEERPSR